MGDSQLTLPALCSQYFVFLLLILIAQVAAGVLFYFNMGKVSTPSLPVPNLHWTGHVGDWPGGGGLAWGWGVDKRPQLSLSDPAGARQLSVVKWGLVEGKAVSVGRVSLGPRSRSTPLASRVAAVLKLLTSLCLFRPL